VFVDADATRIRQIVQNLLANALSHTPEGGRVSVHVAREGGNAVVSVRDSGPGIAAEDLERIFERFYRVDESRGRERGGAGLGLSIVRRLVELHGGKVWAESMPGLGATFVFTLPVADSE
jgi:signal transduction histidine kinase